jgi:hypothetical protein
MGVRGRWALALVSVVLSHGVILGLWSDARFGTIPNLFILGVVIATLLSQGDGNLGGG